MSLVAPLVLGLAGACGSHSHSPVEPPAAAALVVTKSFFGASAYRLAAGSGVPSVAGHWEVTEGAGFYDLALHPAGNMAFLAVTSRGIFVLAIDPQTGMITQQVDAPVFSTLVPSFSDFVSVHPSGRFLISIGSFDSEPTHAANVLVASIDASSGSLTQVPGSPFVAGGLPVALAVHPSGQVLYTVNTDASPEVASVSALAIDPGTGALTPLVGSPFPSVASPVFAAMDPLGRFLYVGDAWGSIQVWTIDPTTGEPSPGGTSQAGTYSCLDLKTDVQGRFVYLLERDSGGEGWVAVFAIDSHSGELSPAPGSPFPAGGLFPANLFLAPSGDFLYVVDQATPTETPVTASAIDPRTGALSTLSGSPFPGAQ